MGLNPTRGEINILQVRNYFFLLLVAVRPIVVPVAQLDKASDYESEDWGFESLQGYYFLARGKLVLEMLVSELRLRCLDAREV